MLQEGEVSIPSRRRERRAQRERASVKSLLGMIPLTVAMTDGRGEV